MLTFASTNRFVAAPLPPGPWVPEVERMTSAELGVRLPANCHVTSALSVNTPAFVLLIVTMHDAVSPLADAEAQLSDSEIGRASCRERGEVNTGCVSVSESVVHAGHAVVEIVNVCE